MHRLLKGKVPRCEWICCVISIVRKAPMQILHHGFSIMPAGPNLLDTLLLFEMLRRVPHTRSIANCEDEQVRLEDFIQLTCSQLVSWREPIDMVRCLKCCNAFLKENIIKQRHNQ